MDYLGPFRDERRWRKTNVLNMNMVSYYSDQNGLPPNRGHYTVHRLVHYIIYLYYSAIVDKKFNRKKESLISISISITSPWKPSKWNTCLVLLVSMIIIVKLIALCWWSLARLNPGGKYWKMTAECLNCRTYFLQIILSWTVCVSSTEIKHAFIQFQSSEKPWL